MPTRSGLSYWQAIHDPPPPPARLVADVRCEVAILGGGITGALVAYLLAQSGVDTVLVDKRVPALGSTAASTGLLQFEVDTHLVDLIDLVGEERAVHSYRRGLRAIDEIERIVAELGVDCGFSRRDTLYFASSRFHRRRLRNEYECRRQFGLPVEYLERQELEGRTSIKGAAAIATSGDAQVDPYRLTLSLLDRAQQMGLRVFGDSEVIDIDQRADGVRLQTAEASIDARRIVFAAGYESQRYLSQDLGSLQSTYAVASEPLQSFDGWPDRCLIWETARPYFYARQTDDGRAMIGGADTAFSNDHKRDGLVERKTQALVKRFEKLFPAIAFTPEFTWAGTFGESPDGLPFIGQPPDQPRAYFAVCYGGNGITYAMIAARLIADLCCGRPNDDERVFGFDR